MELKIRRATATDEGVLVAFNTAIAWETEKKRLHLATLTAGVRALLNDPHRGFYTVAEVAGEVVGQIMITYEWSDWRNGWFWWIQSVYVREDMRRAGVFRTLYREIEQQAISDPTVIGLRLYYEHENSRAHATYISLGMSNTAYGMMEVYPLAGRVSHLGDE
jgi:GNAT superfamily N-acetyltransferase